MSYMFRVIYIDDNPHDRELVLDALEQEGPEFDLTLAATKAEFERLLERGGWNVVLSDFNILGYNGLQVIQAVQEKAPGIPIIIITGTGSEEMAASSIKMGAMDYVIKTRSHIRRLPDTLRKAIRLQKLENERLRAEQDLRDLHETMDLAQKMAGIGYWSFDMNNGQRRWSSQMYEIFGFDLQMGTPATGDLKKIFKSEDWGLYKEAFEGALQGTSYDIVVTIKGKDGKTHFVHTQGHPRYDETGQIVGAFGTSQDITKQVLDEKALRDSEEKYRNIFENAVEGFFRSTPEGRFIDVNPAFSKMLGYESPEEVVSSITDIATEYYVDPEDRRRYQKELQKSGQVDDMEFRVRRKDGSEIWVANSTKAYFDEEGNVIRYEGIINDITERIKTEEERDKLRIQLAQGQKMQAIGTLAGGVAHDFNNILSSIIGFSELALENVEKESVLEDSLQEILSAGVRAKELVKQILTFARKNDTTPKPVDVQKAAKEALRFLRSIIPTSVDIQSRLESNALVMGDSSQIQQLFMNLCTNAAYAMEKEGGVLEVQLRDVTFDEHPNLGAGRFVEIRISDTGIGIHAKHLSSIFDPYFTTKGLGEGTGLGLAVVHGIVKQAGGDISVQSDIGKGTVFTTHLPALDSRTQVAEDAREDTPVGTERILFVDDEKPIARMSRQILKGLGYEVMAFTSSSEALDAFRSDPNAFDLVVTDMTMPQMNGDKLAKAMLSIRSDIPVILCTGYSRQISKQKAAELGIRAFAMKPLDKRELANIVRTVLDDETSIKL